MVPAEVVRRGAGYLARHGVDSPLASAEGLMMSVLRIDRAGVYARTDGLTAAEAKSFGRVLCRRCSGTPLQHLTGEQGFRRLVLRVRPGVFVPRPETEVVVDWALAAIAAVERPVLADVATGAGPIALSLKDERPDATVWATDASPDAIALARENAEALGLAIRVEHGDLLDPLPADLRGALDLVVANPPYVEADDLASLPAEVRADPVDALVGPPELLSSLLSAAFAWLHPGGAVVVEIADTQGSRAAEGATAAGFVDVAVRPDLAGRDRVLVGAAAVSEDPIAEAVAAARRGDLIVLPTDTVYGIGTRPDDRDATDRLFAAKHRPDDLSLPVLVADADEAAVVGTFDERAFRLAAGCWPGAVTLVVARAERARDWELGGDGATVGVRVPAHPLALAVLVRTGPLAMTSANRSGEPPARTCDELVAAFGDLVSVYLCVDEPLEGAASTVVDLTHGEPRILRAGAVGSDVIERLLSGEGPLLDSGPSCMASILVVCTGNICRSPMAEGLLSDGPPERARRRRAERLVGGHRGVGGVGRRRPERSRRPPSSVSTSRRIARAAADAGMAETRRPGRCAWPRAPRRDRRLDAGRRPARTFTLKELGPAARGGCPHGGRGRPSRRVWRPPTRLRRARPAGDPVDEDVADPLGDAARHATGRSPAELDEWMRRGSSVRRVRSRAGRPAGTEG